MVLNIVVSYINEDVDTLTHALETAKNAAYEVGQYLKAQRVSSHSKMHSLSVQIGLNKILKILNWRNFTGLLAF